MEPSAAQHLPLLVDLAEAATHALLEKNRRSIRNPELRLPITDPEQIFCIVAYTLDLYDTGLSTATARLGA